MREGNYDVFSLGEIELMYDHQAGWAIHDTHMNDSVVI